MVGEGGLQSLSMHKLARALDYTPGALYRYFSSKEALLQTLNVVVLQEIQDAFAFASNLAGDDAPLARVFLHVEAYRRWSMTCRNRFGLLAVSLADQQVFLDDEHAVPVKEAMLHTFSSLVQGLVDAQEQGQIGADAKVSQVSIEVFGLAQGLLQMRKQQHRLPFPVDLEKTLFDAMQSLFRGNGSSEEALTAAMTAVATHGKALQDHLDEEAKRRAQAHEE